MMPMVLKWAGSKVTVRVVWGKTIMERPRASCSAPSFFARVNSIYNYWVASEHQVFEDWILDNGALDDKGAILERLYDTGEDNGLKGAHVIGNDDAWARDLGKDIESRNLDVGSYGF